MISPERIRESSSEGTLKSLEKLETASADAVTLSMASRIFASSIDLDETFRNLSDFIVPTLADCLAITLTNDGSLTRRLALKHVDERKNRIIREFDARHPRETFGVKNAPYVIRTREPVLVTDVSSLGFTDDEAVRMLIDEIGLRSYMILPLLLEGDRVIGAIWMGVSEGNRRFTQHDLELGWDLATLASQAVFNATLHRDAVNDLEKRVVKDKIREEFIYRQVHDIKTPITAVLLQLDLMAMNSDEGSKNALQIQKAKKNISRAVEMINNLKKS